MKFGIFRLALPDLDNDDQEPDEENVNEEVDRNEQNLPLPNFVNPQAERARAEIGRSTQARLINTYF